MALRAIERLPDLYERDETAWLEKMAGLIRDGRHEELDFAHLAEYLGDMSKRDRREVESRLVVLVSHLLKWTYQPGERSKSWQRTVLLQQRELRGIFESETLRRHAIDLLPQTYRDAVRLASAETGLPVRTFPADCPFTLEDLESFDILAG